MKRTLGADHRDQTVALNRIEGQVRGIQKMVRERRYCVEILNAIAATRGALKKVESAILRDHLNACARNAFTGKSEKEKEAKLKEICGLFESLRK